MLSVIYEPFCDTLVPFFIIQDNFGQVWHPNCFLRPFRFTDRAKNSLDSLGVAHSWPFSKFSWLGWDCSWYATPLLTCLRGFLTFWKLLLHTWDSLEDTWASSPSWRCTLACLELILTTLRNFQTYWLRFLIHLRLFPQYIAFPRSLLLCWVGIFEVTAGTFETPLWL